MRKPACVCFCAIEIGAQRAQLGGLAIDARLRLAELARQIVDARRDVRLWRCRAGAGGGGASVVGGS